MTWWRPVRPSAALAALAAVLAAAPAPAFAAEAALPARDAVLLMTGREGGTLPIESSVRFEPVPEGDPLAIVGVEVPAWSLLELAGSEPLPLLLAIYAVDAEGGLVGSAAERFRVAPAGLVAAGASGLRLSAALELPAGELTLRVLLKAGADGAEFGLRALPVEMPAAEGGPDWLAIELASGGDDLMDQLRRRVEDEAALQLIDEYLEKGVLVQSGGRWLLPPQTEPGAPPAPALPVVASADRLQIDLLARGRPVRPPVIELVSGGPQAADAPEQPAVPLELRDLERLGGGVGGWNHFRARLDLPALGDGRYRLRFQPPARGRGQEVVVVRGEAATITWAELVRPGGDRPEPIEGGTERARPAAAERHLERAVGSFAAAGVADVEPLEELFLEEWERAGPAGATALVEAGNRLAWELVAEHPEALVPLVAASAQLYRRFLEREQWGLSTAARRLTVIFLDVYSRGGSGGQAGRAPVAAVGWASFAGDLLESGLLGRASALYKRALEIDSKQVESLVVLGAIYERAGQYDQAAQSYRRLLEISPDSAEPRLRLAVQLARIGQQNDAQRRLGGLLEEQPDWVAVVAAQELARLHLDSGRPGEATEVLGTALARHPRDEKLLLFRAAVDELNGDGSVSDQALAALGEEPSRRTPSARHRYAAWPPAALGDARSRLAAAAEERRPELLQALRGGGGRRR
jgi:tetratricopeptide (TPR) repeat protein